MQITKVAILGNPKAGKGKARKIAAYLVQQLSLRNINSELFLNDWPTHCDNFSDVWLIGGDGTINYFINHYPNCQKPLAVFRSGTGNDFAWKLYGDLSLPDQLTQILNGHVQSVDVGQVNQQLFINCLGIGFDGELIKMIDGIRFLGGHLGYLFAVLKKIFYFKEYKFKIQQDNEIWNDPFLLVHISNSSRAGGGFHVAPKANISDGKLDMVLCRPLSILNRLRYLPVIEKGNHLQLPFVVHRIAKEMSIENEKIIDISIDGELYQAKNLLIKVIPGKFYFRY